MGIGGSSLSSMCFKRKNRFFLTIDPHNGTWAICTDASAAQNGVQVLFPTKTGRPSMQFKEFSVEHICETIWFPGKPEWKPVQITLFDTATYTGIHPVMEWIKMRYNPCSTGSVWTNDSCTAGGGFKIPTITIEAVDGCGNTMDIWQAQNVWVQNADFCEMEYNGNEVLTCDITLRYDRAIWMGASN